jgi:hypothetical protein
MHICSTTQAVKARLQVPDAANVQCVGRGGGSQATISASQKYEQGLMTDGIR